MNLDLTTAIEAAARAEYEAAWESLGGAFWDDDPDEDNRAEWRRTTAVAIAAAAPLIAAQVAEQIAAAIEEGANARAAKRDEHREIAIARRAEGNLIGHDAHMRTALSFRSEAMGMWDAAAIAREAVR